MAKIHLLLPDNTFLCGNYGKEFTRKVDDLTCKSCIKSVKGNRGWYSAQWEKFERQSEPLFMSPNDIRESIGFNNLTDAVGGVLKDLDICRNCGNPVRTMVYKGSGYCSENCKDEKTNEETS